MRHLDVPDDARPGQEQHHLDCPRSVAAGQQFRSEVKAIIEAQAGLEPQYSSWHGRNHHNLDEHPRPPKVGREASPRRRVCRVDPFVPNSVVIFEQTHVGDPDLGA
jgi:hypothetical protein